MRRIRGKNTGPEMLVRKMVHGMGYRYRLHKKELPGKPDLSFPSRRKVIFVHGCFWHQHDSKDCKIARVPKSNLDYWEPKLERNRTRDLEHQKALRESGWEVLVVWECELKNEFQLREKLNEFLRPDLKPDR